MTGREREIFSIFRGETLFKTIVLFVSITLALRLAFTLDEFTYSHASWLVSRGELPYRSFALLHPPFVELLFSPVFWLTNDGVTALLTIRCLVAVLFFGTLLLLEKFNQGRAIPGLTMLLALSFGVFGSWMLELRPDSLALGLVFASIFFVGKTRDTFAAICLGLAAFTSEKAWIYGAAIPLGIVFTASERDRFLRLTLIALTVTLFLYSGLVFFAGFGPVKKFLFDWAVSHETAYLRRGAFEQLGPFAIEFAIFFCLGGVGIVRTLKSGVDLKDRILFFLLILGFISYWVQRGAYIYSLLPVAGPLVLFASRSIPQPKFETPRWLPIVFIALTLLPLFALPDSNREQLILLRNIEEKVPQESCVYDNSGTAVTRPHVRFYFFTDALMRKIFWKELETEVPKEIVVKQCFALIKDKRFYELPPNLQKWLNSYFPKCENQLCLTVKEREA